MNKASRNAKLWGMSEIGQRLGLHPSLNRVDGLLRLAGKVVGELSNPSQLTPARIGDLVKKGVGQIAPLLALGSPMVENSEIIFGGDPKGNGFLFAYSKSGHLMAVVFPESARIHYVSPLEIHNHRQKVLDSLNPYQAVVQSTTIAGRDLTEGKGGKTKFVFFPSEGYQDHTGIVIPFTPRKPEDHVQHGGILADNSEEDLEISNYSELQERQTHPLRKDQSLIEGVYYLDSSNLMAVCERRNLRVPLCFNTIGVFRLKGRKRFFTFNNDSTSMINLGKRSGILIRSPRTIPLANLAVISNVLASYLEAQSWAIVGLEFNNGGTYFLSQDRHLNRNYITRDCFLIGNLYSRN